MQSAYKKHDYDWFAQAMATLQIRDLPDPLHQHLQLRARRHHRSLSQQALSDLQQACGGDPRERRRQALADLQALAQERGNRLLIAPRRS